MRVALYARYSSENQKESSIDDQFRTCEQRAAREGWTITARYEDKAISGAIADRPGYQQMLTDAKAKQFDILLLNDFSRLSRDMDETERARKRLVYWGVRIIGVTDGIDTSQKGHKLHSRFKGMMNEEFIEKLAEDIKRGMVGQAEKCYWQGGRVYGYKLVPELHPTRTDAYGHPERIGTTLAIDPEQAAIVREIFQMYADGLSPLKIVNELNRRQIPAPGAAYKRTYQRPSSWSAAALHGDVSRGTGLLNNPLYAGRYIWNRSRREKDPETGSRAHVPRPSDEWIEKPMPHLRIVSDDLWERVKARRQAVSQSVAALRASLHCRATSTGAGPKYLFSGLLVCGVCGAKYVVCETLKYGCSTHRTRGNAPVPHGCPNDLKVSRTLVESVLLESIQRELFTEESLALFRDEVARLLAEQRRRQHPENAHAAVRLQEVEREILNISSAIKQGILTITTKTDLEKAEAERARLLQTVQGPSKLLDNIVTFLPNLSARFETLVDELAVVMQGEVDKARGILRELVGGAIRLHPAAGGVERFLTAELSGDYAGLLRLAGGHRLNLVAVTRIERVTRGL